MKVTELKTNTRNRKPNIAIFDYQLGCVRMCLTRGQETLIDYQDYHLIKDSVWSSYLHSSGRYYYAQTSAKRKGKKATVKLHRHIMNYPENLQVDHISQDTLDNRRSNLRLATQAQNLYNTGKKVNNKSGYKGVSKHTKLDKYQAFIRLDGKSKYLGLFSTPEEAALKYNEAAKKYHGEFANLNVVE